MKWNANGAVERCKLGRAPHGARGLKFHLGRRPLAGIQSRPARGAWIEIRIRTTSRAYATVAPRMGRVD